MVLHAMLLHSVVFPLFYAADENVFETLLEVKTYLYTYAKRTYNFFFTTHNCNSHFHHVRCQNLFLRQADEFFFQSSQLLFNGNFHNFHRILTS